MKILITGFDPFDGEQINPSWEVIQSLPDEMNGHRICKKQIPTVFNKSIDLIIDMIDSIKPDIVIALGQAGGRSSISVERLAINLDDARIKDNEGNQPVDIPVNCDGENAYFSNLPVKAMVHSIHQSGIPAILSNTAGTFVCNHIMYGILHYIKTRKLPIRGGFIHVPYIPSQVTGRGDVPSMSLETIKIAILSALTAAVENSDDLKISYGREF